MEAGVQVSIKDNSHTLTIFRIEELDKIVEAVQTEEPAQTGETIWIAERTGLWNYSSKV
jgi:hypothetical protein